MLAHYPNQEVCQSLGTVLVPIDMSEKEFQELFGEWRSLVGEYPDDDDPDCDEKSRWCEPDTDGEFIDWLVEKHGCKRGTEFHVFDVVFG